MFEYLSYIFFFTTLIILLTYIYIRIKYGFWAIQPVFHVYDIGYMIYSPGIINHELPQKNKYTNFKNIETIVFQEMTELKMKKFVTFIKINYLQNKDNTFHPKDVNIIPYFKGHNDKSFVSFYNKDENMIDLKKGTIITDQKISAIMTSRPVNIVINNSDKNAKFTAYYIDYLCVDKSLRKKGIAPQMIQTHHYNQSHLNTNVLVSLFKRENELTGIVPLCVYSTYGFSVNKWTKPFDLHPSYKLLEINPQNFHFLHDFIQKNNHVFDIVINIETANIVELIKSKNIFIYTLMDNQDIQAAYFYRKSCTFVEKGMEVLSCFASINHCNDNKLFIQGFKISFWKIAAENYFGFAALENISHNNIIIEDLCIKTKPLIISPTAYFFYNFAYKTFNPGKCFIIN